MATEKIPCPACHGTGQWTFFGGVSRFFFTVEECPECGGLGFLLPADETAPKKKPTGRTNKARRKKE